MKITLQQIIDAAWQKFIAEDGLPSTEGGWCSYRTKDGRACAIGLCLPDGHPATTSGDGFYSLTSAYPDLFAEGIHDLGPTYLDNFQRRLHDDLQCEGKWQQSRDERAAKYRGVAKDYGLTLPNGGVLVTP
jgi:hypothetical protein